MSHDDLEFCYFCRAAYGACSCDWPDPEERDGAEYLFEHHGTIIAKPNVSVCGRFFVNPVLYYGAAYVTWFRSCDPTTIPGSSALVRRLQELRSSHDSAIGALCIDDGTGCCAECGVAMTVCDACGGVGYHCDLCPESDETVCMDSVRADLAVILERRDLFAYRDALGGCDHELLAAIRSLGFDGRDDLTPGEMESLLRAVLPVLRRIAGHRSEVGP
jgi:hypothetical protein